MLTFNLKKEWFEKIKSGEKTHEYRQMTAYWITRINNALKNDKDKFERTLANWNLIYSEYISEAKMYE